MKLSFFKSQENFFWNYRIADSAGNNYGIGDKNDQISFEINEILEENNSDLRINIKRLLEYFGYNDILLEVENEKLIGGEGVEILSE